MLLAVVLNKQPVVWQIEINLEMRLDRWHFVWHTMMVFVVNAMLFEIAHDAPLADRATALRASLPMKMAVRSLFKYAVPFAYNLHLGHLVDIIYQ